MNWSVWTCVTRVSGLNRRRLEERLLASIAQRGIEEPLEGVEVKERSVLLNGFKRYRCARKLRLATVPYSSLGPRRGRGHPESAADFQ